MEGISLEELQLATRNHGMPLEALRYDVTPVGLHYLLIHYDIPAVDPDTWSLTVDGRVANPLRLTLDDLRARPSVELTATMECAGNGRARFDPRPVSQPWLNEAVGTARWRGVALSTLLAEAQPHDDAVEAVFTGLDRGVEKELEQDFQRSVALDDASDALLAYEMNGAPLNVLHGAPLRLRNELELGFKQVKWVQAIEFVESFKHLGAGQGGYNEDHEFYGYRMPI